MTFLMNEGKLGEQANMIGWWYAQRWRKIILVMLAIPVLAVVAVTHSPAESTSLTHNVVEAVGWLAIVICIVGRTWCALYLGNQKNRALVRRGPYSIVRNPLYLFSVIGALGIGLAAGSIIVGLALGIGVFVVFNAVVIREERFLLGSFGNKYREYLAEVPRWMPNIRAWSEVGDLYISPTRVATAFRDAALFALAIPILELLERLQDAGIVPVLLRLP